MFMAERNLPKKKDAERQRTDLIIELAAASREIERRAATSQGSAFWNFLVFGEITGYHAIADKLSELGGEHTDYKPTEEDISERIKSLEEDWKKIDRSDLPETS